MNADLIREVLAFAFRRPSNTIVSLVCREWREEYGSSVFHLEDLTETNRRALVDPDEEAALLRRVCVYLARTRDDPTAFSRALDELREVDDYADYADGFLLEAARNKHHKTIQTFYAKEYVFHTDRVPLTQNTFINTPDDGIVVEIPMFHGSGRAMTSMVYLNDQPLAIWYHGKLRYSFWITQAMAAYCEYARLLFLKQPLPHYMKAYIANPEEKLRFAKSNVVWAATTTRDANICSPELKIGLFLNEGSEPVYFKDLMH